MSLPHHNLVAWQRADDRYRVEGALVKTVSVVTAIFAAAAFVN